MNPYRCKSTAGHGQDRDAPHRHIKAVRCRVPEDAKPCRLDVFLGGVLREAGFSREKIKQAVISGQVRRNGRICDKPDERLFPGDEITASLPRPDETLQAEQGDISVLWSDEHLAVIDKPAGLTVHPAPGLENGTLAHRLLHHFPKLAALGGPRPGIVHRLDKDTSGLMLVALDEKTRLALSDAFAAREIRKTYLALAHGAPAQARGSIREPIGRDPVHKTKMAVLPADRGGKEAHSDYAALHIDPAGKFSLLRVAIHTGRTHQIRVHMRHIGHPLVGDSVYGNARNAGAKRQMLHAWQLAFTHPITGENLSFCVEPPGDFLAAATDFAMPMQRVVITGPPGSGKSALTNALRAKGLPVWSADESVRNLYARGGDGWYLLRRRFGDRFVPNGNADVDKKALFAAMLSSEELRLEVERLIHPLARHELETFWEKAETERASAAVAEVPLYLEAGWRADAKADRAAGREILIGVYCPFTQRRARMIKTRGWNDATIAAMESWQWAEDKKIRAVDLVVDNSGDFETLQRRAQSVVHVLTHLRDRRRQKTEAMFRALWACDTQASPPSADSR